MSVLEMDPAKFPAPAKALYEDIAARRRAKGEGFGGPYLALLNHPALAERVEALGFYLKFEGVLPRVHYQFIVLSVAHATGAAFEWQDHVQHALAARWPPVCRRTSSTALPVARRRACRIRSRFCARFSPRRCLGSRSQTRCRRKPPPNGATPVWSKSW
jgi:hypothetical protein